MAISAVQRKAKGTNGASISIGAGDGWATPTSGNLLVVTANSDATVTITGTWTAGPSVVDGNGTYTWYRISNGTESTITCTPSVSDTICITAAEYSGVAASPFDTSNSSTISGSGGATTTAVSVTTAAAGDLIVAAACLHSYSTATAPTGPSWTNSFVNQLTAASGGTTVNDVTTFYAELIAGAAGSYSTAASWTNNTGDRQELVIAFLAAATSAAVPVSFRRARTVLPPRPRPRQTTPVRAQVNPPYQPSPVHRTRQVLGRFHGRVNLFAPPQVVVPAPTLPPAPVHRLRQVLGRVRGHATAPAPLQTVAPPPLIPAPHPPRRFLALLRRPHATTTFPVAAPPPPVSHPRRALFVAPRKRQSPVPPQVVVVPPPYPPQPVYRRLLAFVTRRGRAVTAPLIGLSPNPCVTPRPFTGTTGRPGSGTTARPDTGVTDDPC